MREYIHRVRRWVVAIVAAVIGVAVVAAAAVFLLNPFGPSDPADARCDAPPITFGDERDLADHREVDVQYTCEGAVQSATIYLPDRSGPDPAVVWIHGAGEATRIVYAYPLFTQLVQSGVAVLSYDKRGVGESEGECCPGDTGHFNLLTADIVGAMSALRSMPDIDPDQIGLIGASQAGWIAPRAVIDGHAAYLALASAPTVAERTTNLYERLRGGEEGQLTKEQIAQHLRDFGSQGFDPRPYLQQLTIPGLWEYGTADVRTPVDESITVLNGLKAEGKEFTIDVFDGAGHGLLDTPPTDPEAGPTMVQWILDHVQVSATPSPS